MYNIVVHSYYFYIFFHVCNFLKRFGSNLTKRVIHDKSRKKHEKLESVGKLKSQDFWPDHHIKLILLAQNILRLSLFGPYLDPKMSEETIGA